MMSDKFYRHQSSCHGKEFKTKSTITRFRQRNLRQNRQGFLRDRLSNDVSQILRRVILVVMATKFEIIAYNSVCIL